MKNNHKAVFDFHGNQMNVIFEGIRQHMEKKSMKELDEHLEQEYPEFVNHGKVVTEEEAKPQ